MFKTDLKQNIKLSIQSFSKENLTEKSVNLFQVLGYNTERQSPFTKPAYSEFKESYFETSSNFNEKKALVSEWNYVDLLFQLSEQEIQKQTSLFDTGKVDRTIIETYLFFAIGLTKPQYTRTELSQITREVNRLFPMPVMLLFKHGESLTLSIINRRLHKRDESRDVLEKVTLIKDIKINNPHRAHIEILFDLSFDELHNKYNFTNFVELHNAWQKTLDTKELNKKFYKELSNWYFWAMNEVYFPGAALHADKKSLFKEEHKEKEHNAKNLIRMLTRLLFVWFVKEKGLIPEELFDEKYITNELLLNFKPKKEKNTSLETMSCYYRAILQNLFFATLNQNMGKREFRKPGPQHMNITNLMRYKRYFKNPDKFIKFMENTTPFMNGGLFECLDVPNVDKKGRQGGDVINYLDGFSDRPDNPLKAPDYIFFSTEEFADLSEELDDKKQENVPIKGLINIFKSYKFTVAENTPIEEEVALDPELLGRVFENLLASYNPETKTTARKQTGSFYTPREIVSYMVDESLKAYLKQKLESEAGMKPEDIEIGLGYLVGYNEKGHDYFTNNQKDILIDAIDSCKILDPACGSGAFPMGILHKLTHILHKLDPQNKLWKEKQLEKVDNLIKEAGDISDSALRDKITADLEANKKDIEESFSNNELDYGRKLYLIENCIYGVDIQPIATQISKLRFFISLIVDQKVDKNKDNFGIRPLPNLETKFVAANTLIGIDRPKGMLRNLEIDKLEEYLKDFRHKLFSAKTPTTKRKLREEDKTIREKMCSLLIESGWENESARQLAGWDPYDQNASSPFFDPEWMFGLMDGFDVVIGNPPYINVEKLNDEIKKILFEAYLTCQGRTDIYIAFIEKAVNLLKNKGTFTYIIPYAYTNQKYGLLSREMIIKQHYINEVVDTSNYYVFESAVVKNVILRVVKTRVSLETVIKKAESENAFIQNIFKTSTVNQNTFLSLKDFRFETKDMTESLILKAKVSQNSIRLDEICLIAYGARLNHKTKELGKDYFIHDNFRKGYKPFTEGKNINRYNYTQFGWLDFQPEQHYNPMFPELFENDKIIFIRVVKDKLRFAFDQQKIYNSHTVINCVKWDLLDKARHITVRNNISNKKIKTSCHMKYQFILAILNSTLINWYFLNFLSDSLNFYPDDAKELPIQCLSESKQEPFINIVDYLLAQVKENNIFSYFDRLIDCMVYELYLPNEIKAANAEILKHLNNLPELKDDWSEEKKLAVIEKVKKELSDPKHPVSIAMVKMQKIPEIKIIEGKK